MRDGSGNASLPYPTFTNGTTADGDQVTANNTDIANMLTQSIATNGESVITANIPMATFKFTGLGAGSAATDSANLGQIQAQAYIWCGTAGGTQNALTLSPTPAIAAYAAGQKFRFIAGAASSDDAVTVAISGLTTKAIQNAGSALSASDVIAAGKLYEITYDGTAFQISKAFAGATGAASETSAGIVELATDAETATGTDTARAVTPANLKSAYIKQGTHTLPVPAAAMYARTTNGAASGSTELTTNKVMVKTFDFDAGTDEFVQFQIPMPKSWNEGTVTAEFLWSHASTTTNFAVVWGIQGLAISNDDALDQAFGTAQTVTDTGGTTNDLYISDATSAMTIAGSPAAGDMVIFQVYRDADNGSDTLAVDARLHAVQIYITLNAADDS